MTTLIYVRYGSGETHRCDARCYNAHEPDCTCICKGANHGIGEARAVENVMKYTAEKIRDLEAQGAWIPDEIRQQKLI